MIKLSRSGRQVKNDTYLAFYKGKGNFIDKVIRFFTRSKFSHCEIAIRDDGDFFYCFSSSPRDGGVREKHMQLKGENWELLPFDLDQEKVQAFYNKTKGLKYDFWGAVRIILPFVKQKRSRYFCSEWIANELGLENPSSYSPGKLEKWAEQQEHLEKIRQKILAN